MKALLPAIMLLGSCASLPSEFPSPPPHVAHAWQSFDESRITGSGAAGPADKARGRAITVHDPARIASVSKLVVALGVMRLVEQGRIDLDRDVSGWLGWPLRNPAFPDEPVTLRLLLSHRSSLQDAVDYAVPLGVELRSVVEQPAAFDTAHRPGTYFRYANLGFPVIASVLEKATGERFDRLMERLVIAPLGIEGCFNWAACGETAFPRAVVLYAPDGAIVRDDLGGRRPDCPVFVREGTPCDLGSYRLGSNGALFSPQGGLRISIDGLRVIGQLLLANGRHRGQTFLTPASIAEMMRPHWRFDGSNGETEDGFYCGYGLGMQLIPNRGCKDDLIGGNRAMVGHAGDAYRLKSGLWIDRDRGRGIAYLATGIAEDAPKGETSFRTIEEWLARRASRGR